MKCMQLVLLIVSHAVQITAAAAAATMMMIVLSDGRHTDQKAERIELSPAMELCDTRQRRPLHVYVDEREINNGM